MKITFEIRVIHEQAPASTPAQQYPPMPPKVDPKLPVPVTNFRGTYL